MGIIRSSVPMKAPPPSTQLEKVAGSVLVEATVTIIAALAGGSIAAMLPVLTKSLASERQQLRVEKYLADVSQILQSHEETLRNLSDAQYKLINEAILTSLQTTQEEKLKILINVVRRSLDLCDIEPQEAISLSRIIRDISAEEVMFVVKNFSYRGLQIAIPESEGPSEDDILDICQGSRDELLVSGLISLGVLTAGQPTLGQVLGFSPITAKLIVLLKGDDAG